MRNEIWIIECNSNSILVLQDFTTPKLTVMDPNLIHERNELKENYKTDPEDIISNQKASFFKFMSSLLLNSSIIPVSRMTHFQSKLRKTFWFIVFLICTFGCCYEVYIFLNVYLQYPVIINVEVRNNTSIDFPAVTVCNLNRMKNYNEKCILQDRSWKECKQVLSVKRKTHVMILSERKQYTSHDRNETKESYSPKAKNFMNHYTNIDAGSRRCYGYMLYEMIHKCSFGSILCKESDFTFFQSMQYGNCYTFNKQSEGGEKLLKVSNVGPDSGLELELDLNVFSYLDLTQSVGARVVIHNPDEDPNPEDVGINISPGFESHISLIKTSIQRLPAPYRDHCIDYRKSNDNKVSVTNQLDCVRKCIQDLSIFLCACVDPFLPASITSTRCDLRNSTQMSCLDDALFAIRKGQFSCGCPLPCTTTTYSLEIGSSPLFLDSSSSVSSQFEPDLPKECEYDSVLFANRSLVVDDNYPTDFDNNTWWQINNNTDFYNILNFPDIILYNSTKLNYSSLSEFDFGNWTQDINDYVYYQNTSDTNQNYKPFEDIRTKSRAKLQIFYRSLDHTVYSQTAMFSESEIFAHLGGHLGLWLGISLVALFECAENMLLLLTYFCKIKNENEESENYLK